MLKILAGEEIALEIIDARLRAVLFRFRLTWLEPAFLAVTLAGVPHFEANSR